MSCSGTQHGAACRDRTQDLSIRGPTHYHYSTALPYDLYVKKCHISHTRLGVKYVSFKIVCIPMLLIRDTKKLINYRYYYINFDNIKT